MGVFLDIKKSIQRDLIVFSFMYLTDYRQATMPSVTDAKLGETCYRTDLDKLYQLQEFETELGREWVEVDYDFFFIDWDAHAQLNELPNNHLIGTKNIGARVDEHFVDMDLLIALSMFQDTNFKKHDIAQDALFSRYLPTKNIAVYSQIDGSADGAMIVKNGTEILPMAKADQRPVQFMSVALTTDRTVRLD